MCGDRYNDDDIEKLLQGKKDGIILVDGLFLSNGSSLFAYENKIKKYYGMELDEKDAQTTIQRYCDNTSLDTIKINGKEISWSEYKNGTF